MKTYIKSSLFGVMAASVLALAGCTSEISVSGEEIPDNPYAVRFSMGGSANTGVLSRASESGASVAEHHTDEESKVYNLIAVVFRDEDQNTFLGQRNAVANNDPCVKAIEVIKDGSVSSDALKPDTGKDEYFFYVKEMGAYHICFLANADENLTNQVKALANSGGTYSSFRNLKVEKDPGTKDANEGMTMTTGSYGVVIDGVRSSNLETVSLTRIMSRIDIYNAAPNIVIKKVKFNGRMIKTPLIETYAYDADNVEPAESVKEYTINGEAGLPGAAIINEEINTYKAEIYSYPHYGTVSEGTAPSLTLHYVVKEGDAAGENEYEAEVRFTTKDGADLNLMRNNLYRLVVSQKDGKLNFELIVADWNEGGQLDVSGDDISIEDADNWNIDAAVARLWATYIGDGKTEQSDEGTYLARYAVDNALKEYPTASAEVSDFYCNDGMILRSNSLSGALVAINNAKSGIDSKILDMTTLHEIPREKIRKKIYESVDSLEKQLIASKESIAGIVAYLIPETDPNNRKVYTGALAGYKGLVLALKNASGPIYWASSNDAKYYLADNRYSVMKDSWANDIDGFTLCQTAQSRDGENLATNHPAINAAMTYNNGAPAKSEKTTGWYLPSANELWDMFGPNGLGKMSNGSYLRPSTLNSIGYLEIYEGKTVWNNVSASIIEAGGAFSTSIQQFWTASECPNFSARLITIDRGGNRIIYDSPYAWIGGAHFQLRVVRSVLAFK